ncbi:DoxX family protein [Kitasatospora kazusensis]|uniref:DoxX family protein n=1 Tax=Kitasatospora kazusensis TaxID=407974 RepID=A0ABP5LSM5_9ACTN
MSRHRAPLVLAALLGAAGVMHFRKPEFFDAIVPEQLPGGPRLWTELSGAAELAVAAAVAVPATRRVGGLAAATLFAAVFPANVKMALDWKGRSAPERALAYGRLPLQIPLVLWALKVRRDTPPR